MNKPLDLTKPVQTMDGKNVRVLCTDKKSAPSHWGLGSVLALIEEGAKERTAIYTKEGVYIGGGKDSPHNLRNIPEVFEGWGIIYQSPSKNKFILCYSTEKERDRVWALYQNEGSLTLAIKKVNIREEI